MSKYQIERYANDTSKERLEVIQAFSKLRYVRSENSIGAMVLTLPKGNYSYEDFRVGQVLEIWREKYGVNSLQNETAYFIQDWEFYTDSQGHDLIDITATDANWLLDTRVTAWAVGSTEVTQTDYADDMIKVVANKNIGANARFQKITVAPELGLGASISKQFAWRNMLTVLQEIAEASTNTGTYLVFDVVRIAPCTFELRTYTGQRGIDHSRTSGDVRLVGKQYGNLVEPRIGTYHSDEINHCYVGGWGEGSAREIGVTADYTRQASSHWNRREIFIDGGNATTNAQLDAEGNAKIAEMQPKQIMTGQLVDTPGMRYGIEYGFGDIVSVEAFGQFVDCHVSTVMVTVDGDGGEQLDIRLKGEL